MLMQICYCRSIIADMNVNFPPEMGNDSKDGIVGDRPSSTNGKVQNHVSGMFLDFLGCLGIAGKCNKVLEHKKGAYFL